MKNVFILSMLTLFSALVVSCKDNDDYTEITNVYASKIDSVQIPMDTMALGVTQEMKLYSTFTKACEGIYSYDYQYTNDSVRTVANFAYKTNDVCGDGTYVDGSRVNFKPTKTGTYTFKFWTGKDTAGTNTFLEKKVVVE
ncbi:hypothetical protein [Epilithonimonas hungarica]|uniref:Uncharacterized protein n=1 Tax=Epilithonimonas hungarica TaxID=454006 RepID=A0A1G7UAA2_9FLAO|nr:hypothetical protein [Epilithonimonas hungarica]MPT30225.1 hypothetical protein [Chryseobacterium sp.]SDG44525.1 hypothetical protein SAMN05421825_3377 [Epilithonimonas hungarica]